MSWFRSSSHPSSSTPASHENSSPFIPDPDSNASITHTTRMGNDDFTQRQQATDLRRQDGAIDSPRLPMAEIGMINKKAQIQGTVTGITAGILFALVTRNVLRQSANITMVAGLASGTSVGYYSTRSNLHQGMRHLQEHHKIVEASKSDQAAEGEMQQLDLRAGDQRQHEGGVAGMYNYQDRSHSTRGDH